MSDKTVVSPAHRQRDMLYRIVFAGFMSALVYVGNFMSIPLADNTRIHLGNSMCLLAGLLFGGVSGGCASGIGAVLYDIIDPRFVPSPITFFNKFAMGFAAGFIRRRTKNEKAGVITGAVIGQLIYIFLYLGYNLIEKMLLGEPFSAALVHTKLKAVTSCVNGLAACVTAIPLYFALEKALKNTAAARYIEK